MAVIINLKTRRIISHQLSKSKDTQLPIAAFKKAIKHFTKPDFIHNDRGGEYLSKDFAALLKKHSIPMSCTAPGRPDQNCFVERAIGSLRKIMQKQPIYNLDASQIHQLVINSIYYYKHIRPHSSLKMMTPVAYENKLTNTELDKAQIESTANLILV